MSSETTERQQCPDGITLLVCLTCGRTDRFTHLKRDGWHLRSGKRCPDRHPVGVRYTFAGVVPASTQPDSKGKD